MIDTAQVLRYTVGELDAAVETSADRALRKVPLPEPTRRAIKHRMATELEAALHRDLVALFTGGWQASHALRDGARRSLHEDGDVAVELESQRLSEQTHPEVELVIDGVVEATVRFTIEFELALAMLTAVLRAGYLVAVEIGRAELALRVRVGEGDGGPELFAPAPRDLDTSVAFWLPQPIRMA